MNKIVSFLLAIVMLFSLTACGGNTASNSNKIEAAAQSKNDNDNVNTLAQSKSDIKADKGKEKEITFTEVVAVDNDECSIKITGVNADKLKGVTLKAQLENKSTEKTYMFSVETAAINGIKCDPFFAAEVAAGKKSNNEIRFTGDDLKENGVGDYTDIELTFRVYDTNDWMADPVAKETVHIYPYGEDKAVKFVRESQPDDNIIVDNEFVTIIVTGYENDKIWGYTVNMFLLNKTDKDVMFSVDDASINGFMADPFYATTVPADKCAFSSMSWSNSTLENNDISTVEEIEFKMRAYDSNDWFGGDFANEIVILNP